MNSYELQKLSNTTYSLSQNMDLLFTKNSRMTTYAELYYYTGQVGNISFVIQNYPFFCL